MVALPVAAGDRRKGGFVKARWILAASASAGHAGVYNNVPGGITARYWASPGEVNDVTATLSGGKVTFTDSTGVTTHPDGTFGGSFCSGDGRNVITCSHPDGIDAIEIRLEDQADKGTNNTALPGDLTGDTGPSSDHDVIVGGSGPDYIDGANGNDTITGNGGSDELIGGGNNDIVHGNAGNDDITGDLSGDPSGSNTLYGDAGNDTIVSSEHLLTGFAQQVYGGTGNDFLYGAGGPDTITGGDGIDLLDPSEDNGADYVSGGADKDVVDYLSNNSNWGVTVTLDNVANDGPTQLTKNDNVKSDIETVWGSPKNDSLTGNSGAQTLNGFGGDDLLDGQLGPDHIYGGAATDTATYEGRPNPVTASLDGVANDGEAGENDNVETDVENLIGGSHDDTLIGNSAGNSLYGSFGGDTLKGGGNNDGLYGEGSNDTLDGGTGADYLDGEDGFDTVDYSARVAPVVVTMDLQANDGVAGENDLVNGGVERVIGGSAGDTFTGDADSNTFEGRGGPDDLTGAGGVDFFDGGNGADTIGGGDGNDVITNGSAPDGADTVAGGAGGDLMNYSSRTSPLNVSIDDVADDGEAGENDNVKTSVERVFGGSAPDGLQGSAGNNVLAGGGGGDTVAGAAGDDTIQGGSGIDSLFGGDDQDVIDGGTGADSMAGGPGTDTADYSGALAGVNVTIDDVANDGVPAEGDNVATTIENVIGGRFDDNIDGNDNPNSLFGGLGTDTLRGFGEADVITGAAGADDMRGGNGPDELHAKDGTQDSLICGGNTDGYAADNIDTVNADCENVIP
jgi:Ca2+-binding RTX toxin-like protein